MSEYLNRDRVLEILGSEYGFAGEGAEVRVWRIGGQPQEKFTEEDVRRLDALREALPEGILMRLVSDPALLKSDAVVAPPEADADVTKGA